jgi:hypothetical protein
MGKAPWVAVLCAASALALAAQLHAQSRPYLGYVYPAGGQQGSTFEIKVGGQNLTDNADIIVSGSGVTAKLIQYCDPLGNRESALLSQQLRELTKNKSKRAKGTEPPPDPEAQEMINRIQKLLREEQRRPACAAFRGVAFIEVAIAPNAPPGERELRFVAPRTGASNPMVFHVGQVPEHTRKPMLTAPRQILGKESQALRSRPASEAEERVNIPCTVNGQIASREINTYRFPARKGQRLVITTQARQLVPYIADAVPGWFQPVLVLYDTNGKEVAYDDDYRYKPDPVILYEVPKDGEYVLGIFDSIFRGRNDFIYRITMGEMPFVTSIFPLGARVGGNVAVKMKGWNLDGAEIKPPARDTGEGVYQLVANRNGTVSNPLPFALDTLPELFEKESNDTPSRAQKVTLPVMINGRIDKTDDWDVFQFTGKAGDTVVAEVYARRLESPVDSVIKLTDAKGNLIAFNDDCEDLSAGVNTHHADSYCMAKLPADGAYYVHIGDTGRHGGEEYGYRLRISAPRPDFALRIVPSSAGVAPKGSASLSVFAIRKDGFDGDIKLTLKNPPEGFSLASNQLKTPPKKIKGSKTPPPAPPPPSTTLPALQPMVKIQFKAGTTSLHEPVNLHVEGRAQVSDTEIVREAVPAEDRMQAFLWRHLVPAQDFKVVVFGSKTIVPTTPLRVAPELTPEQKAKAETVLKEAEAKGRKFTKSQVAGLARNIKVLYERGLITDKFYGDRIAELGLTQ